MAPYNFSSSFTPPLYTFNYATGILALLSNTPGVDLSCETGTCGYDSKVYATVAIADPSLAPYGVAAQTVLTGRYGLDAPLSSNPLVHEYPNITATFKGIRLRRDNLGSVRYAERLNSAKSSVTFQRTDRHGMVGQKPPDFQLSL